MNLKKKKQNFLRLLGNYFLAETVTLLCNSLRIIKKNEAVVEELKEEKQNFVLAFWHGTMLLPWYLHRNEDFSALTSQSKDGDLLSKVLTKWKYNVVRGSSSSGGDKALSTMIDHAKNNYSITITPDGPGGPRHIFKPGGVITAKKSSVPLVLAGVGFKNKKVLSNWDKFEIPYFFTKANIRYSKPIYLDENLSYEETSAMIKNCEAKLNQLQEEAQVF